jgi:hypothetical protein
MVVSAVSGDEVAVQSAVDHTKHAKAWLGRNDDALPQKTTEICILKRPQLLFSSHGVSTACIDNRSSLERHAAPDAVLRTVRCHHCTLTGISRCAMAARTLLFPLPFCPIKP